MSSLFRGPRQNAADRAAVDAQSRQVQMQANQNNQLASESEAMRRRSMLNGRKKRVAWADGLNGQLGV